MRYQGFLRHSLLRRCGAASVIATVPYYIGDCRTVADGSWQLICDSHFRTGALSQSAI